MGAFRSNVKKLPTSGQVASINAPIAYKHVLAEFAVIANECRKHNGLSVEDVAEQSGVKSNRIRSFEAGSEGPSWHEALLLASVYRVRVSTIVRHLNRVVRRIASDEDVRAFSRSLHTQRLRSKVTLLGSPTSFYLEPLVEKAWELNSDIVDVDIFDWPVLLDKVAPKYFGLNYEEARRRAPSKLLPCRAFRLGGQKSPWLISAADLAELIDRQRQKAG